MHTYTHTYLLIKDVKCIDIFLVLKFIEPKYSTLNIQEKICKKENFAVFIKKEKDPVRRSDYLRVTPCDVRKGTIGKLYSEDISHNSPKKKKREENIANCCLEIAVLFIALSL